jgi:hypothetical protein
MAFIKKKELQSNIWRRQAIEKALLGDTTLCGEAYSPK